LENDGGLIAEAFGHSGRYLRRELNYDFEKCIPDNGGLVITGAPSL
jgi:hypothetical protein